VKPLTLAALAAVAALAPTRAAADAINYDTNSAYHYQQSPFFCAIATVEMQLDEPSVTGTNANVGNLMANVNGANANGHIQIENGNPIAVLNGDWALQSSLYGTVYGPLAGRAFASNTGVSAASQAGLMNLYDSPFGGGIHGYAWYNQATFNAANRTLAVALATTNVSASAAVNSGTHAINVYGVQTTGAVAPGGNFLVNGFLIHDPWTGLFLTNPGVAHNIPGFGINTYMRVGADYAGGQNVQTLNWGKFFNPSRGFNGYVTEVEPIGPVSADPGLINSIPPPPPELAHALNASGADTDAVKDLAGNSLLDTEPGLSDGHFDSIAADELFLQDPGAAKGQGDWLIPYDGPGGSNDVTGALLIDAGTGVIDQATWFDSTDPVQSFTLQQLDLMYLDEATGNEPVDNVVPEPGSTMLMGSGLIVLACVGRSRRKARRGKR
jgi:hypothetical protein